MRFFADDGAECPGWDFVTPDFDGRRSGWWFTACRAFVEGTRGGWTMQPTATEGMHVSAVLAAMTASLDSGQAQPVPSWGA